MTKPNPIAAQDYTKAIDSIASTIAKGGKALTESQRMLLAGAVAVWLDQAWNEEKR